MTIKKEESKGILPLRISIGRIIILTLLPLVSLAGDPIAIPGYIPDFKSVEKSKIISAMARDHISPETDNSWATPKAMKAKWQEDEWLLHIKNPMAFYYDLEPLWEKKESIGLQGEATTEYWYDGKLLWSDHHIGTGSGGFSVTAMTGYAAGDRILVHDGNYTATCNISNMDSITVQVELFTTGIVVINNQNFQVAKNFDCIFTGGANNGVTYGFEFTGNNAACFELSNWQLRNTFDHIYAHDLTHAGNILFENQNGTVLTFDGVNSTTKLFNKCTVAFVLMHKAWQILAAFRGTFKNMTDSCNFQHIILDTPMDVNVMNGGFVFNTTFSYLTATPTLGSYVNDQGLFLCQGTVSFNHCIRYCKGTGWGWFARTFSQALDQGQAVEDIWYYSNICVGNISYSFVDNRTDTTGFGPIYNGPSTLNNPKLKGTNVYIVNNTIGNFRNDNTYVTPIVVNYNMMLVGYWVYVANNLRFNANNTRDGNIADSTNVFDFSSVRGNTTKVSSNLYYPGSTILTIITDTVSNYAPRAAGAPLGGTGNTSFQSVASTSYNGLAFAGDIGAVKFSAPAVCNGCLIFPRNSLFH